MILRQNTDNIHRSVKIGTRSYLLTILTYQQTITTLHGNAKVFQDCCKLEVMCSPKHQSNTPLHLLEQFCPSSEDMLKEAAPYELNMDRPNSWVLTKVKIKPCYVV